MSESAWTKIRGWPGYRVYRSAINEEAKTLRLWVRASAGTANWSVPVVVGGSRKLPRSTSARSGICRASNTARQWIELYRVRCPDCGIKAEKVALLPSQAPFSKRFEEAVGQACESAAVRRVRGSLTWQRARCGRSICGIWSAGRRGDADRPCGRWESMRSTWGTSRSF